MADRTAPTATTPKTPHSRLLRVGLVLLGIALLVALGWLLYAKFKPEKNRQEKSAEICGVEAAGTLTARAQAALDPLAPNGTEKLRAVTEEIKQRPGYETDGTCLYPIIAYYLSISSSRNARDYFTKLERAANRDMVRETYPNYISLDDVRKRVEHLEETTSVPGGSQLMGLPIQKDANQ